MMASNHMVSVIVPALNEEKSIGDVVEGVERVLSANGYKFEIIVVSGRSTDKTSEIARMKGAKVIAYNKDPGKGYAIRKGLKMCKGDIVVLMDADGSHVPEELPLMLEKLAYGHDIVVPSRFLGSSDDTTPLVSLGNRLLTLIFNILFYRRRYVTDSLNGFKAIKKKILDNISLVSNGTEIEVEILAKCLINGSKMVELPSHERRRISGVPKGNSFRAGLKCFGIGLMVFTYHLFKSCRSITSKILTMK